jgi:hypothetical protein
MPAQEVAMNMKPYAPYPGYDPEVEQNEGMYKEFDATELFCPKCKGAVPVRKRLLLVLPEGDKYEYLCAYCGSSVGSKIDKNSKPISLLI